ncbi:MAG: hypothetical protein AAB966_01015 [Patescibacteria group bacterium]
MRAYNRRNREDVEERDGTSETPTTTVDTSIDAYRRDNNGNLYVRRRNEENVIWEEASSNEISNLSFGRVKLVVFSADETKMAIVLCDNRKVDNFIKCDVLHVPNPYLYASKFTDAFKEKYTILNNNEIIIDGMDVDYLFSMFRRLIIE